MYRNLYTEKAAEINLGPFDEFLFDNRPRQRRGVCTSKTVRSFSFHVKLRPLIQDERELLKNVASLITSGSEEMPGITARSFLSIFLDNFRWSAIGGIEITKLIRMCNLSEFVRKTHQIYTTNRHRMAFSEQLLHPLIERAASIGDQKRTSYSGSSHNSPATGAFIRHTAHLP